MVELVLRVDKKGRILIPSEVRALVGLGGLVRVRVEENRLVLEPMRNPLEELMAQVLDKGGDVEEDIASLRRAAEEALLASGGVRDVG